MSFNALCNLVAEASPLRTCLRHRRTFPVRFTQALQLTVQKRIIRPTLASTQRPKPPLLFRLVSALPVLQRIPGRLLAVGVRPEHVRTLDVFDWDDEEFIP